MNTTRNNNLTSKRMFTCGRYSRIRSNGKKFIEGGLRTEGIIKDSKADLPLVSIITVSLNSNEYISKCIESVINQTYENIEYILIDGGSNDGTLDRIKEHRKIDYFVSEPDNGLYEAMNKGLMLAMGEYIIFLNSDDWYTDSAVELLVQASLENAADIAHADAHVVDAKGKELYIEKAWLHDGIYTRGSPLRHETMLVSKLAYERVGAYDESYRILSDFDLMIRLYREGLSFIHVDAPLLYFRNTGISSTEQAIREAERARLFSSIFPFLDSEDIAVIKKHGRLTIDERLAMLEKHRGKSELFARSMAFNIADSVLNCHPRAGNRKANFRMFFKKKYRAIRGLLSH